MDDQTTRRLPLRLATAFLGLVVLLLFLWTARSIFVVSFLGLLFGVTIVPVVDRLQRYHIPRGVGAALVVAAIIGVLIAIGALLAPVLQQQALEVRRRIPEAIDRLDRELAARHIDLSSMEGRTQPRPAPAAPPASQVPLRAILGRQVGGLLPYLFPFFSTTLSAVTGLLLLVFLAIFFAADPLTYKRGVLHLVPHAHRERATSVLDTMGRTLRAWVAARSIAMVTIGVVVTGTMALLGVRAFVALGVIAGILEFVPVFGPIAGAVPAIALAFADSPQKALWVAIAFLIIQQLEGNVLIPMLLQRAVEVPPALSLVGIASLGIVLGLLGVLIAEPLVAAVLVAVKMLYVEPVIGDRVAG
jgi:predicted PurR-regulated permease PerM